MNDTSHGRRVPPEAVWLAAAVLALVVASALIWVLSSGDGDHSTPTPTVSQTVIADLTGATATIVPAATVSAIATSAAPSASDPGCPGWCLIRLGDSPRVTQALQAVGVTPTHTEGGS